MILSCGSSTFRTLSRFLYPVCLLLMSDHASSYCPPSVGFDVLGIHQPSQVNDVKYFLTVSMQAHHHDPAIRYDYLFHSTFIPIFHYVTILAFVLILEHSFWFAKLHPRFSSIATAFRICQSSFSTSGKALVMLVRTRHYQCLSRSKHTK